MMSLITIVVALGVDIYILFAIKRRCKSRLPYIIHIIAAVAIYAMMFTAVAMPYKSGDDATLRTVMWILFCVSSILIGKVVFFIGDIVASIPKLFKRDRCKTLSMTAIVLGMITFISMWCGSLVTRFQTEVKEFEIKIDNLPREFDGYKIVQISDLHVGTLGDDTSFTERLTEVVNSLNPDIIVFTGDIVNRRTSELIPQVPVLSGLHAKDGVYSILGNHDYGDYTVWPNDESKRQNMQQLYDIQKDMGWKLLLNEHVWLHRGNDSIALIGVENVGDPPFHTYGSLSQAYHSPGDSAVKILLSHNPAHWNTDIADNDTMNIALTLSGHTHAMQMSICGISPAAMRYKTWGGLYTDKSGKHKLYVNIGAGTVGIPMRLGATPEITLFTIKR